MQAKHTRRFGGNIAVRPLSSADRKNAARVGLWADPGFGDQPTTSRELDPGYVWYATLLTPEQLELAS